MDFQRFLAQQGIQGRTAEEYLRAAEVLFGVKLELFPNVTLPNNIGRSRLIVLRRACALAATFKNNLSDVKKLPPELNPWPMQGLPREHKTLPRWFNEHEYIAFSEAAHALAPLFEALVLLGLYLGFRRAEILNLSREQVADAVSSRVLRFKRKGGKDGELPLNPKVQGYFRTLLGVAGRATNSSAAKPWRTVWQILSPTSFDSAYGAYRKLVKHVATSAGLSGVKTHTMRHSFATNLVRKKVNLKVIQQAMGHENAETTMIYAHADLADVAHALE